MNSFSCVITGHRPTRFKFKYNEKDKRCQRIKKCLQEQLIRLYNQGVRCFWAGGAMGADMWASEILLRMKEQTAYQDVELCLALPFEGYDADWDDWHRKRMKFIRKYAAKVLILGEMPSSENYKKRNCFMVDQAGCMVAVYDNVNNMRSGTQQTVRHAEGQLLLHTVRIIDLNGMAGSIACIANDAPVTCLLHKIAVYKLFILFLRHIS